MVVPVWMFALLFPHSSPLPPSYEQRLPPHPIDEGLLLETCFALWHVRGCEHGQRSSLCLYSLEIAMRKPHAEWPLSLQSGPK